MNEFQLISAVMEIFRRSGARPDPEAVPVPNGDDAAVVRPLSGMVTATTDALVEGVHFSFEICSRKDAGFRSVAVNVSDLAAMCAAPAGLLLSLILPDRMTDAEIMEFCEGVAEGSAVFGIPVVGGNITRTEGSFVASITALGDQKALPAPLRSGARPGDSLWVSGFIGDGAFGLDLLLSHPELESRYPSLALAYRRPQARIDLSDALTSAGVHACIDISDGFAADVGHLLEASRVGCVVDVREVPISPAAIAFCRETGRSDMFERALTGGDDYQLAVAAPPEASAALKAVGMHQVGVFVKGCGLEFIDETGRVPRALPQGWLHRKS